MSNQIFIFFAEYSNRFLFISFAIAFLFSIFSSSIPPSDLTISCCRYRFHGAAGAEICSWMGRRRPVIAITGMATGVCYFVRHLYATRL